MDVLLSGFSCVAGMYLPSRCLAMCIHVTIYMTGSFQSSPFRTSRTNADRGTTWRLYYESCLQEGFRISGRGSGLHCFRISGYIYQLFLLLYPKETNKPRYGKFHILDFCWINNKAAWKLIIEVMKWLDKMLRQVNPFAETRMYQIKLNVY
jgi:hypothetical protein